MKFLLFIFSMMVLLAPLHASAEPSLTDKQKASLISAVEDEIYDYNLERSFASVGKALSDGRVEVPLFVTDKSTASAYYLIYRLMPYGEMYRVATVSSGGMVNLFRNPNIGFPPDAPATLTVYYDDDSICEAKRKALRLSFIVELRPTRQRLQEAIRHQNERYGFSNLERESSRRGHSH